MVDKPEFVERMREAAGHINKARDIINRGPLEYYLEKLVCHSEALLTKFAPMTVGDRAIITESVPCKDGWKGSEQNLAAGVSGDVTDVDYDKDGFLITFVPDVQMYRTSEGKYLDNSSPYSYCIREKYLTKSVTSK